MQTRNSGALILALLLALGLAAPAWSGMAELGKNGSDTSSGNGKVKMKVNPNFERDVTSGDTSDEVLEDLQVLINDHPQQAWTATHDAGSHVITVVRKNGKEADIEIKVEGTSFEAPADTGFDRVRVQRGTGRALVLLPDEPAGDGMVTLDVNLTPIIVSTSGLTAASLLAELRSELASAGFVADVSPGGLEISDVWDITWEHTDTGIDTFGVGISSVTGPTGIPTLSEWGMIAMLLLTMTAAFIQLRRRGAWRRVRRD